MRDLEELDQIGSRPSRTTVGKSLRALTQNIKSLGTIKELAEIAKPGQPGYLFDQIAKRHALLAVNDEPFCYLALFGLDLPPIGCSAGKHVARAGRCFAKRKLVCGKAGAAGRDSKVLAAREPRDRPVAFG